MNITRILTENAVPYGVRCGDGTPLFFDSLINEENLQKMFDEGWELCGLPYDFRKDGLRLLDIEKEEYKVPNDVKQDMYDMIGTPVDRDKLLKRINVKSDSGVKLAEGNYIITTRKEFLHYLDNYNPEFNGDFKPVNFFVHPDALFTYKEYFSAENAEYIDKLNSRRVMPFTKYTLFLEWAFDKGLNRDFTPMDLVNFYFSWGIDGLNVPIVRRTVDTRYVRLRAYLIDIVNPGEGKNYAYKKLSNFFVDKKSNVYTPDGIFNVKNMKTGWEFTGDTTIMASKVINLEEDELVLYPVGKSETCDVTILDTSEGCIEYDYETLSFTSERVKANSISILDNYNTSGTINTIYWNPNTWDKRKDISFLKLISAELVKNRTVNVDVSSYKALLRTGCSPAAALKKIWLEKQSDAVRNGFNVYSEVDTGDDGELDNDVPLDIEGFIGRSKELSAEVPGVQQKFMESAIQGDVLIDALGMAKGADSSSSDNHYVGAFQALCEIWGIQPMDIYRAVRNLKEDENELVFMKDGKKHKIEVVRFNKTEQAFKEDLIRYRREQAQQARIFMYVRRVARELGSENANRHIAVQYWLAEYDDDHRFFKRYIDKLVSAFHMRLDESDYFRENPFAKDKMRKNASVWAATALFDLFHHGVAKYYNPMGGEFKITEEERLQINKEMHIGIDDIVTLTDLSIDDNGEFTTFCTNAYITPEWVVPIGDNKIDEVSLAALWYDEKVINANVRQELIKRGHLTSMEDGYWNSRFYEARRFGGGIGDEEIGLGAYVATAEAERAEYPRDKEYVSAKHYFHSRYPYFGNDERGGKCEPREGQPGFAMGYARSIAKDDIHAFEEIKPIQEEEFNGIRKFNGITCDDFIEIKGEINYPGQGKEMYCIDENTFYAEGLGEKPYNEIEKLDPKTYPVSRLTGRKLIFRDPAYRLWEVIL
jgi:hypothetical protein